MPGAGGRRPAGHRAVRERLQRHHQLRHRPATPATRRRRSTPRPAAAARGSTTSGRPRSGPGGGRASRGRAAARTRASGAELAQFVEALPDRRADADLRSSRWWPRPGRRSPWARACRAAGRSGYERDSGVRGSAGTPAGSARMSPAEVAWRARDQALQAAWSAPAGDAARQLAAVAPPPGGDREFTAVLPPGTAALVPEAARAAVLAAADRLLRGEWEVLGVVRTDLVTPDWFHDPVTGRRSAAGPLRLPDQPPLGGADRQHQAGLGDLPAAAPHAAGHGLVPQPRRAVRRPGGRAAALLVAGEPLPVRRELDERHRGRHPPDQPGLDPAPAGRLAGRGRPVRA